MIEDNLKWEFKMEDFPKAAAEQVLLEDTGEPEAILSGDFKNVGETLVREVLCRFSIRVSEREPEPPGPDGGWGWLVCLAAFYCVSILDGNAS